MHTFDLRRGKMDKSYLSADVCAKITLLKQSYLHPPKTPHRLTTLQSHHLTT